jgi:hypothetical protein
VIDAIQDAHLQFKPSWFDGKPPPSYPTISRFFYDVGECDFYAQITARRRS